MSTAIEERRQAARAAIDAAEREQAAQRACAEAARQELAAIAAEERQAEEARRAEAFAAEQRKVQEDRAALGRMEQELRAKRHEGYQRITALVDELFTIVDGVADAAEHLALLQGQDAQRADEARRFARGSEAYQTAGLAEYLTWRMGDIGVGRPVLHFPHLRLPLVEPEA